MKKTLILTLVMAAAMVLSAAAMDRLYIEDFTIAAGKTRTVSMKLDNETAYTAFQCDLYLPEGLSIVDGSFALTERKSSSHSFTVSPFPNSVYRLMSYSMNLKTYSGNNGALVTFDITASEDFSDSVVIALKNILFTTEAGVEVPFGIEECIVTKGLKGDVNVDSAINIKDVTALIGYLMTSDSTGIDLYNADVNEDEITSIKDVTTIINMLMGDNT